MANKTTFLGDRVRLDQPMAYEHPPISSSNSALLPKLSSFALTHLLATKYFAVSSLNPAKMNANHAVAMIVSTLTPP
jgi:hypothetical protein